MRVRKVHTKIWRDEWFLNLSRASKILFTFLITNEYMGLSGYAEVPDSLICFHTGLSSSELTDCKKEVALKIKFYKGWVYIVNLLEHDPIIGGEKNNVYKAYIKELASIPDEIKQEIQAPSKPLEAPPEGVMAMVMAKEKGKKRESAEREKQEFNDISYLENLPDKDFQEFLQAYNVSAHDLVKKKDELLYYCKRHGKTYKDYRSFLQGALLRDYGKREIKKNTRLDDIINSIPSS